MSIAWDASEAVRHVFTEGCLRAVETNKPVKETLDRGVALSLVRTLESSPLIGDPPGTPAYAVISSASVVITGTGTRCTVAASSGEAPKLRATLLDVLDTQQVGWQTLNPLPDMTNVDLRCRALAGGVMIAQIVTAPGKPLQAFVFRSNQPTCSLG